MTGFAFPEILVQIYDAFKKGNVEEARSVFFDATPLLRYEGQKDIGLAIRKEILKLRGAISCSLVRHPGPSLDKTHREELELLLRRYKKD